MNQSNVEYREGGLVEKSTKIEVVRYSAFPSWCCQRCGDNIGWVGRFIFLGILHTCKKS